MFRVEYAALAAAATFSVIALAGCATIVSGTSQTVSFESEPEGVTVRVNGKSIGKTPTSARLDKRKNQTLTFELEGYRTVTKDLQTGIDPWVIGNIIIGGVFGTTTDFASGAIYEYSPDQYFVTLPPEKGTGGLLNHSQQVKRFIVANFNGLQSASASPEPLEDEVFEALVDTLGIHEKNDLAIDKLTRILLEESQPVDAAKAVSEAFGVTE